MSPARNNFHVITGCSGGGKSTIIDALRARGFNRVDEAGRQIVQDQVRIGGDGTPWQSPLKFRDLLFARYVHLFEQAAERGGLVFFDRAIPEVIGISRALNVPVPEEHRAAARIYRSSSKVFVLPPWNEIFRVDDERKHSYEGAVAEYPMTRKVYAECGYQLVGVPKAPVPERIEFILNQIEVAE